MTRPKSPEPSLPFAAEESAPPGAARARPVTIEPQGEGYVILDGAGRRVFGSRIFPSPWAAEVYLQEANRRSRWVRWRLRRGARPKGPVGAGGGPTQLPLL